MFIFNSWIVKQLKRTHKRVQTKGNKIENGWGLEEGLKRCTGDFETFIQLLHIFIQKRNTNLLIGCSYESPALYYTQTTSHDRLSHSGEYIWPHTILIQKSSESHLFATR